MVEITEQQFAQYQALLKASGQQMPMTKLEQDIEKVKKNPNIPIEQKDWVIANLKDREARKLKNAQNKERNRKIDRLKIELGTQERIIKSYNSILKKCEGLGTIQQFEFLAFEVYKISLSDLFKTIENGFDTRDHDGRIYFRGEDVYFVNRDEIGNAVTSCLSFIKSEIEKHTGLQNKIQAELDALLKE